MRGGRTGSRLGVLYALVFLYTAAMGVASPLVPQFLRIEFGAGPVVVGLVVAVYGGLQIVARVPFGAWADRWGRRASVFLAFAATAAGGACYVFAPSVAWVVAGQVLYAVASSAFWVAANAYVVDVLPTEKVPRAMTHYSIAMGLGFLAGPLLGGLADVLGFRVALGAYALLGVAGAAMSLALLDTGRSDRRLAPHEAFARAFGFLEDPVLRFSAAGTFTFALLVGALTAFLPLHLRALGYGAATVGAVFTAREGAALLLRFGIANHLDASRAAGAMLVGVGVAAASVALIPLARGALGVGALSVVAGLGIGAVIPANLTLIASAAPAEGRSLAMGLYGTALGLGTSVSPPVLGWIAERWSLDAAFVVAGAAAMLLCAALAVRLPARTGY